MVTIRELRDRSIIRPIKRAVEDHLLDLPGVVAVDIGDKHVNSRPAGGQGIVVSVTRKLPDEYLPTGARVPASILGVPTDVVEVSTDLHFDRRDVPVLAAAHECHSGVKTVMGGDGIAPDRSVDPGLPRESASARRRRVGTLGAVVIGHAPSLVPMGLTTFDVACMDDAWSVGDRMLDPRAGLVYAGLARAALSSKVDAAAVTFDSGVSHGCVIAGIGPVSGQSAARTGETVRKAGYGSSFTQGVVASTDATVRVDHGQALGVRVLREQLRVTSVARGERFAGPGDSGAVLVNVDGRVVGLHIAGSQDGATGFACPIADVLTELDVDLCVTSQRLGV